MKEPTKKTLIEFPYIKEADTGDILILDQSRYSLKENYKVSLRDHQSGVIEHYYMMDFDKLVDEGVFIILGLNPFEMEYGSQI